MANKLEHEGKNKIDSEPSCLKYQDGLPLIIEFGGGMEVLFDNKKRLEVAPPSDREWNIGALIHWLKDKMKERKELFVDEDDQLRPGILVLVNEVDWEILGEENYVLQPNDRVLFISTLHGG